jgi:hypothetical protein
MTDEHKLPNESIDELVETPWTDDVIRWPDDPPKKVPCDDDDDEEEEETGFMDPFKDPDPFQIFSFNFQNPLVKDDTVDITIRGYKSEADEIWQSTGLTLWRASEFLCEFQLANPQMFQGKRVLEVRRTMDVWLKLYIYIYHFGSDVYPSLSLDESLVIFLKQAGSWFGFERHTNVENGDLQYSLHNRWRYTSPGSHSRKYKNES